MSRTLIVIKPEMVDATNQAIAEATGNPDDIYTFTVQLLNDKEEVIGYACSWDFEATGVDFDAIRKVIETQVGATKNAAKTKLETATGDLKTSKVLVYDESKIDAKEVVVSLRQSCQSFVLDKGASAATAMRIYSKVADGTETTLTWTSTLSPAATVLLVLIIRDTGYTANPDNPASSTARLHGFYKTAAGGETGVTLAWTNSRTSAGKLYEIAGFSGTPTLDVQSENSTAGATSLSTDSGGTGPTNTANPALAFGAWAAAASMGATVSFSNSFGER